MDERQVMVRMPNDLHAALKERAEAEERSVAQAIRFAVRQYLTRSPNQGGET